MNERRRVTQKRKDTRKRRSFLRRLPALRIFVIARFTHVRSVSDSWTSVLPNAQTILVANVSILADAAAYAVFLTDAAWPGIPIIDILAALLARRIRPAATEHLVLAADDRDLL